MADPREKEAPGQRVEPGWRAAPVVSVAETALLAREQAVGQREEAADRREEAADRRDEIADRREEATTITARLLVRTESELREANEHLVVAAVQAQTITEAAEHATALMAVKAERDFLTGLPNRALLADRLAQSIELAHRHGTRVALMFLDLDHFKVVNDTLGHAVGDQLLQSAAKRLQACVRGSDTVSRQGGDEFVVLLTEVISVHDTSIIAEKLIKAIARPHLIGDHQILITLSIGISLYPDDSKDVESVLTHADTAMYSAKRRGRNNYQRFSPDMRNREDSAQSSSV